jgi:UDP-N-acetylglucosamine 2-epimerase (non-hydrolysing)
VTKRICIIAGTRPEAIKLAPVINLLRGDNRFKVTLATTGQHTEMLDQAFRFFNIEPDLKFSVMEATPDLLQLTSNTARVMSSLLSDTTPDMVLVQGDTTTAMVAALASFYSHVKVGHVEAGLRSFSLALPFPEEANRRLISVITDIHFAPTLTAKQNLITEGISAERIVVTGNTVIDALFLGVNHQKPLIDPLLTPILTWSGPIILVTAHRRESWGDGLRQIASAIRRLIAIHPDLLFVLPMHRNPIVRDILLTELSDRSNIILTEPLEYGDLCTVLNASKLVLTDSGGLQEEAPALGKPVLVLRTTTERPEGITSGHAVLVGTSPSTIVNTMCQLLDDHELYNQMSTKTNPYGDGNASARIQQAIAAYFHMGIQPLDFTSTI